MKSHPFDTVFTFAYRLFPMTEKSFSAVIRTTIRFIAVSILSTSSASAAVTYQYDGNNYENVVIEPSNVYDSSMSIQVSFIVDSPLNNVSGDISHLITNYTFFDGVHTLTEANSVLGDFSVRADRFGNITNWSLEAYTIDPADPTARRGDISIYVTTSVNFDMSRILECFDLTRNGLCYWTSDDAASVSNNPGSSSIVPTPPAPDIKINGADGPLTLTAADTIQLSLRLNNNGRTELADWWLVADSPYGYLFWTPTTGWTYDRLPAYQGRLYSMREFSSPILPIGELAPGKYRLFFGVDLVMDGAITRPYAYSDSIEVDIVP